jgi:DNA-binding transcriptional regulator LsrR (DeoR family)
MTTPREIETVIAIARMRWEERCAQVEIARRLDISEATVSRALKRAFDLGLVEVRIAASALRQPDLEAQLTDRFGLSFAIVVATQPDDAATRQALGEAVARRLDQVIERGSIIGVSDGETTAAVARATGRSSAADVQVVSLIGGVGAPEQRSHPAEVCRTLAHALGAKAWMVPLPAVVDDGDTAKTLRTQKSVAAVFAVMERLDIALLGIGGTNADAAIVRHGVISEAEMRAMAGRGAVGTICARFYDGAGKPLRSSLDQRTLAITPADLRRARLRIAVAFGEAKRLATAAALQGGWINGIGTDADMANALLAQTGRGKRAR